VPYDRYVAPESSNRACPQPRVVMAEPTGITLPVWRTPATPLPPTRCSPDHSISSTKRRDRSPERS
jgi:hypothetical protein